MEKNKIKLFCLPHAGGSSIAFYEKWINLSSEFIDVIPIELAGRGSRFCEPLYESFELAIDDVFLYLLENVKQKDFAIFGHSMGALLAFEVISKIETEGLKKPKHLFISGKLPPHAPKNKLLHTLEDNEFIKMIYELGGSPSEIIDNNEIFQFFLPILRSDMKNLELYSNDNYSKISCDITVLYGRDDKMFFSKGNSKTIKIIDEWQDYTDGSYNTISFEGGHFFINNHLNDIIKHIDETLTKDLFL